MTVYPLKFDLGPLEVTGYGIMLMVGFLMAGWAIQHELRRRGLKPDYAGDIVVAAVIGGVVGAKVWYAALYQDPGALVSRGGMVWYGGFIGGFLAVVVNGMRRGVPFRLTLELTAPALALGYALGRVGCFLVQDDYGVPTALPWGLRFPEGLPPSTADHLRALGANVPAAIPGAEVLAVHPTQLYEVTAMLVVFAILWRLRAHRHGMGWLFGVYLMFAGAERFLIEMIRAKDDRFLGAFTLAQLASVLLVAVGAALLARFAARDDFSLPADSTVLRPQPGG